MTMFITALCVIFPIVWGKLLISNEVNFFEHELIKLRFDMS